MGNVCKIVTASYNNTPKYHEDITYQGSNKLKNTTLKIDQKYVEKAVDKVGYVCYHSEAVAGR